MAKHWCAFSERVSIDTRSLARALGPWTIGILMACLGATADAYAQTSGATVLQSPASAEGGKFLELPAFDATPDLPADLKDPSGVIKLRVGDQVSFLVRGLPADLAIPMTLAPGPDSKPWMELGALPTETVNDPKIVPPPGEFRFTLIAIKPGSVALPSLGIKDAAGEFKARVHPLRLEVESSISAGSSGGSGAGAPDDPKAREPVPPRPPVSLVFPWWVLVMGALAVIALIALIVYGLIRYSRRGKTLSSFITAKPLLPEDAEALEALDLLDSRKLPAKSEWKTLYFGISQILKRYLARRFEFDAEELTTSELIAACETDRHLSRDDLKTLSDYFDEMDEVKFADTVPRLEAATAMTGRARAFVQKTRRVPPPPSNPLGEGTSDAP